MADWALLGEKNFQEEEKEIGEDNEEKLDEHGSEKNLTGDAVESNESHDALEPKNQENLEEQRPTPVPSDSFPEFLAEPIESISLETLHDPSSSEQEPTPIRVDPRLLRRQQSITSTTTATPVEEPDTMFYRIIKGNKLQVSNITEVAISPSVPVAQAAINSLDLSLDGNIVAASTLDHNMILMNISNRKKIDRHVMPVQKYGANHVKILPSGDQAITSSTKTNDDLRLLSFSNPSHVSYVRYFKGHSGQVCSLSVSSDGRHVVSAAPVEKKVFLWDILVEKPVGVLNLGSLPPSFRTFSYGSGLTDPGHPPKPRNIACPQTVVSFDTSCSPAQVFGIMSRPGDDEVLKLFDLRNFSKGPFLSVKHGLFDSLNKAYPMESQDRELKMSIITALGSEFNDFKFSPDGRYILINTNGPLFYIFDSISGQLINTFGRKHRSYNNTFHSGLTVSPEISFSQCSQYVLGGNGSPSDPRIYVWSVLSGEEVGIINKEAQSVLSNPNFAINFTKSCSRHYSLVTAGGRRLSLYDTLPMDVGMIERQRRDSA